MKKKDLIGTSLIALGAGIFFYLYVGFIKPRIDFANQSKQSK